MYADALFWIALISLCATSLAAIGARSLREFSRHELEELCRKNQSDLKFSEILQYDDQVAVGIESLNVCMTALFVVAAALWVQLQWSAAPVPSWQVLWQAGLLAAAALLTCKIWIPWAVVRLWATPILFHTWRLWRVISQLLFPLVLAARSVDTLLHRLAGRPMTEPSEEIFEDEIRTIVSEGHREGLLEEDARDMIEGVMELSDLDVAKAMTPRTDVVMMSVNLDWPEVIEFAVQAGHTRIPVYENNRDEVIGILYAKDLLPILANGQDRPPLTKVLRKPYFVPETKHLNELLEEFQKTHTHMAVVLDEYGGVSGLVTIEDVLEEIVGEIVDEYDPDVVDEIKMIDDRTVETLGKAHLDELNDRLGLDLPDNGDYDTIGGFVFSHMGRVPTPGEEMEWQGVRFEVLEATGRRIERLRITRPVPWRETA
ncbi:MAG: CBS domain-containing protein [Planctomycetota bacterium]|nr:CBS domain-containing protein [Planctomycetota bacterium]